MQTDFITVWFVLPTEECSYSSLNENLSVLSQYSLTDMENSKDETNGQDQSSGVNAGGSFNQTGSYNDSRDDASTQMSSPSLQRGFSSDDGSGWRSETTETSEGNISIPHYPIDDRSADESAPEMSDNQEEALSSAINEVSKDFISGNFSPNKYPTHIASGDSDSYSDSDHKVGTEQRGAVYARYPESATGLSDCEWNPYATESDTNQTPRSSNSEGSNQDVKERKKESVNVKKDSKDPITSVAEVNLPQTKTDTYVPARRFQRQSDSHGDSGGESDRSSKQSSRSPTIEEEYQIPKGMNSASYLLYPPDQHVSSDNSDNENNKQVQRDTSRSVKKEQVLTHESGSPVSYYKSYQKHNTKDEQRSRQMDNVQIGSLERCYNNNAQNLYREDRKVIGSSSNDRRTEDENGKAEKQPESVRDYVPVTERQILMTQRERVSEESVSAIPQRDRLSDGVLSSTHSTSQKFERQDREEGRTSLPDPDTLSKRVSRLLDEANDLGAALHSTLYESKGNVLGPARFNSFSPERAKNVNTNDVTSHIDRKSVKPEETTGQNGKNVERGVPRQLERVADISLEHSGRSNADETSGVSSLSEEVAKLMTKVEGISIKSDTADRNKTKRTPAVVHETPATRELGNNDVISKNKYERSDLGKTYKSAPDKKEPSSRDLHGLQRNYDSDDSLGERVKDLLARTSAVTAIEQHPPAETKTRSLPYQSQVTSNLDYSLLQRDLQEIQNSLDTHLNLSVEEQEKDSSGRSSEKDLCLDGSKSSDKSSSTVPGSGRDRKLLWDHAADLGYDSSDSVQGKFRDFTASETDKTLFSQTENEKTYSSKPDEITLTNRKEEDEVDVVADQLEDFNDVPSSNLAPDVEEIIAKYQNEKQQIESQYQEDTSGLASRVFRILTQEPPQKQVFGILEEAMEQEREMMQKLAERPKLDSSYRDDFSLESGSFIVRDKDIKKQLDWSAMSSINDDHQNDKTDLSGLTSAPFSALGNAQTFLSSQLKKTSDRTFNHSIEMNTPYKRIIECYPLYGVERDKKESEDGDHQRAKEAWSEETQQNRNDNMKMSERERPEGRGQPDDWQRRGVDRSDDWKRRGVDRLASERFFLTDQDGSPDRLRSRQRTLSDPRDLSPERDRHTRSHSEEARMLDTDDRYDMEGGSLTDRRIATATASNYRKEDTDKDTAKSDNLPSTSSQGGTRPGQVQEETRSGQGQRSPLQVNVDTHESSDLQQTREESYGSTSPQDQMSNSPAESDTSTKRREAARLRPYRPLGSRDLYYTESVDDSASVADSVTTMESTHTGSDDAVGPHIPPQFLGSRQDSASSSNSSGIYGNRVPGALPEALSTIEERSVSDEKEKSLSADDRLDNPGSVSDEERLRPRSQDIDNASSGLHHDGGLDLGAGGIATQERYDRHGDLRPLDGDPDRRSGIIDNMDVDMTSSIRSDPGQHFATPKRSKKYELSLSDHKLDDNSEKNSSMEQIYGRSRSRSETDLYSVPHDGDQKASSPVHGVKLMEMSSRPSPIYSHHSNMESPAIIREDVRMSDAKLSSLVTKNDIPGKSRPSELSEPSTHSQQPAIRELASIGPMEARAFGLRSADDVKGSKVRRAEDPYLKERMINRPLEKGQDYYDAFIRESIQKKTREENISRQYEIQPSNQRESRPYIDQLKRDDSDIYPIRRSENDNEERWKTTHEARRSYSPVIETRRSVSPGYGAGRSIYQKMMNMKLDLKLIIFQLSGRAKALQERLERQEIVPPNINDMWERFQELNQNDSETSLNASRMETLANLLKNPTQHLVQKYLDDRDYERYKEKKLLQELVDLDRQQRKYEKDRRPKEPVSVEEENLSREIDRKRQELQYRRQQYSEEESNGSYAEILARNERKKMENDRKKKEKNMVNKSSKKKKIDKLGDSADTLFSIPEDVSFEMSDDNKTNESAMMLKRKHERHQHVIDPLMSKLKNKVQRQRDKIDKERRKDLRRMDKLQKLEMLLTAKEKQKLSDKAINAELEYVSTTSTTMTDSSSTLVDSAAESTLTDNSSGMDSDRVAMDTTSTKDSSVEYQKMKAVKQRQIKEAYKAAFKSGYSLEDSEMQNDSDIFQKPRKSKSAKTSSEKKKNSKTRNKKTGLETEGVSSPKKRKDKEKYNRLVQALSPEEYRIQNRSPKRDRSPSGKGYRDIGTMYPSPITKSPPRRRRQKDVYMVSEAIQTTLQSLSPSHDDRRVVSVPLMSPERKQKSCSPSPAKSWSPITANRRQHSRSPKRRPSMFETSDYHKTPPPPPKSKIFTPETPDDDSQIIFHLVQVKGVSWYIPMTESKPWRKPLKEQQAYAVSKEPWQPKSIPKEAWKTIVDSDIINRENTDTKFTLDPPGPRFNVENNSDEENVDPKPRTKMSLQEAFQIYKQDMISRSRARERRINLASEDRRLQHLLHKEREKLFAAEQRKKEANPDAHPYSENLHKPKRRTMTKEEMKELTEKKYKKLPEVVHSEKLRRRNDEYTLYRLRAKVFNRVSTCNILVDLSKFNQRIEKSTESCSSKTQKEMKMDENKFTEKTIDMIASCQ
ncbi:hypothetical protein KUTeg_005249 [Tegillarca granosa]|uniref:ALMS motif domain-containing protein n=1 Tax=Tegillarca granosa TaxID=220873 RepID=A0ABQ9FJ84_TEGGR|nr:hypothetical protein KUTeg_005249 [Tegillarca granosa]